METEGRAKGMVVVRMELGDCARIGGIAKNEIARHIINPEAVVMNLEYLMHSNSHS